MTISESADTTSATSASSRTLPLWLPLLLLTLAFAFQGTRGIWEPDEGRYSSAGINMHESGDWIVPTVDGEHPHLTKPPMIYWALASSFALLGHNEWGARLPSALAFVGTGLFVFGLGRRLCPTKPWLPAAVWATSFSPVIAANIVSTDPLLAFFETASMFAFVEAWSREGADARRWFLFMWVGWGLTFLTKGPPGLLPLLAMIVFLAVHDRSHLRAMFAPAGVLVFLAVAASWFLVVIAQQPDRLKYFLGYEVYDRVFTDIHGRNSAWYGAFEVYLPVLLVGALPWAGLALVAAGGPRAAWAGLRTRLTARRPGWLLLAYWLVLPLTVFCLARSRLQLYILPLFVPIALILARPLVRWRALEGRRLAVVVVAAAGALLAIKGTLAYWHSDRDARDLSTQIDHIIDPHGIDEIVFVGMRPFYGLNVYLDRKIEGIQIEERRWEYSRFVAQEDVCQELHQHQRNVYVLKKQRVAAFIQHARRCGGSMQLLGQVHGDGNDLEVYKPIQVLP